jgi:gliding motility-associated-like protein
MNRIGIRYLLFILFILCIISTSSIAQQSNIWYFGEFAGLNFNTTPPTALTDGKLNTQEGCTSISDNNGNILFYTDGKTVYNRLHQPMPNGTGLLGGPSSTSSAIVIPKPGSTTRYYIFTVPAMNEPAITHCAFSELDIELDGGLGDITSQKNILLFTQSTERVAAVKHANGMDYWIVAKRFLDNSFMVYRVDCNGVNTTAVISNIGFVENRSSYDAIGAIKFSPDGKKICMATYGSPNSPQCQLFDFDNSTGLLTNLINLTGLVPFGVYGVEFSPDSKLLYVSARNAINQYNITSNNEAVINASRYIINTAVSDINEALQLGPDQKIYVAVHSKTFLNVITNPNVPGVGCNISLAGVNLNGRRSFFGLPSYISSFFNANGQVDFTHTFVNCQSKFTGITSLTGNLQWFWDFGDGNNATGQTVNHSYSQLGTYVVTLKVKPVGNCVNGDSFLVTRPVEIKQDISKQVDFTHAFNNCEVQFTGTTDFADNLQWYWDFGDGTTGIGQVVNHTYDRLGNYTVTLKGEPTINCILYDTMFVSKPVNINNTPGQVDFTHAFTNCQVQFNGTTNSVNSLQWLWNFGDGINGNGQTVNHVYAQSGFYDVTLTAIPVTNCIIEDTLSAFRTISININTVTVNAGRDTTALFNLPFQLNAIGTPANASYTWSPVTGLNNPFIANPITVLRNDITYIVSVIDNNGCIATDNIFVKVYGNPEVYVPNSFTPNGDGKNDILKPLGFGLKKVEYFRIYNRYGQLVFETNSLGVGWDGTFKGKPQTAGTYTYMVKVINYRDWPVEQKGTTMIIR